MSELFIVRNHNDHYLGKNNEWVDGSEPRALFRSAHRDDAVNSCFEVSSKDPALRARVESCEADSKGLPKIEVIPGLEMPVAGTDIKSETARAAEPELEES